MPFAPAMRGVTGEIQIDVRRHMACHGLARALPWRDDVATKQTFAKGGLALLVALVAGCGEEGASEVDGPDRTPGGRDTGTGGADTSAPDAASPDAEEPGDGPTCTPLAAHLTAMPPRPWTEDCVALEGTERYLCGETWFWAGLSLEFDLRTTARQRLTDIIEAGPLPGHERDLGRMHALRGQLSLAMVLENQTGSLIMSINPDFDRAVELDPSNGIIATWKDSMDIALTWRVGDPADLASIMERTWENVELCRMGNILSISGTTIGLPLSTGIPQATIERLEGWSCNAADFCYGNTWRAPWTMPGLAYHFGEAYARMGDTERARTYLQESLDAEGSQDWPWRAMAADTLANLDDFVQEFVDLGDDGDAFDRMYANQSFGCVFCHSADPPAHLVRTERIRVEDIEPDPNPNPDPDPNPNPDPNPGPSSGACDNAADETALGTHPDVGGASSSCAMGCISGGGADCAARCMEREVGISTACADCFGSVVQCTMDQCLFQCISPSSAGCTTCRETNCMPAFTTCAGITPP